MNSPWWWLLMGAISLIVAWKAWKLDIVEPYDDPTMSKLADGVAKKFEKRMSQPKSIVKAGVTNVALRDTSADFSQKWFYGKPKAVSLKAAVKHTLANGTEIVGPSWIVVKGHGKTKARATEDAKAAAAAVLQKMMRKYRERGTAA